MNGPCAALFGCDGSQLDILRLPTAPTGSFSSFLRFYKFPLYCLCGLLLLPLLVLLNMAEEFVIPPHVYEQLAN